MIAARWASSSDYSPNRRMDWDESGMSEAKQLRLLAWCVWMQMDAHDAFAYQSSSLPSFFFPPTTPYYYLSISLTPFHEIDKLFHVPTPEWYDNCDNGKWQPTVLRKGSFSLQPSISKAIPLASRADRRWEMAEGSDWWTVWDYSIHGELTSFCSWLNMQKCCMAV